MAQNDDELQTSAQILHGIFQATEYVRAQTIAGHANHEEIVRSLSENEFDRYSGIRATEYGGERMLLWRPYVSRQQAQVAGIDLHNPACRNALVFQAGKELCKKLDCHRAAVRAQRYCLVAEVWPAYPPFHIGM